jgi:serine/threonine-protein kinase
MAQAEVTVPLIVGRYALHEKIAAGGMANVYLGRLAGAVGFMRTVAIKRLHAHFAADPEFAAMFLDEARLAARIRHPNVIPTLDVVASRGELFLVMEYVEGESLSQLMRALHPAGKRIPIPIAVSIMSGVLQGLHAAHEAKNDQGDPLGIVHRDVSPQNIIVGTDGVPRVLDFGVAKAIGKLHSTRQGEIKGKLRYMAPEQLLGAAELDRLTDVFAASIVLWETLAGKALFGGETDGQIVRKIIDQPIQPPSALNPDVPLALDEVVLRGLERDKEKRYQTAAEMAGALEDAVAGATPRKVGEWVKSAAGERISERAAKVLQVEQFTPTAQRRALAAETLRTDPPPADEAAAPAALPRPPTPAVPMKANGSVDEVPVREGTLRMTSGEVPREALGVAPASGAEAAPDLSAEELSASGLAPRKGIPLPFLVAGAGAALLLLVGIGLSIGRSEKSAGGAVGSSTVAAHASSSATTAAAGTPPSATPHAAPSAEVVSPTASAAATSTGAPTQAAVGVWPTGVPLGTAGRKPIPTAPATKPTTSAKPAGSGSIYTRD